MTNYSDDSLGTYATLSYAGGGEAVGLGMSKSVLKAFGRKITGALA